MKASLCSNGELFGKRHALTERKPQRFMATEVGLDPPIGSGIAKKDKVNSMYSAQAHSIQVDPSVFSSLCVTAAGVSDATNPDSIGSSNTQDWVMLRRCGVQS